MNSGFCPNKKGEDYKELVEIFGSQEIAHLLIERNHGYNLDLDPWGNESRLFKELLKITNNDRFDALRLKAQFYLDEYVETHGRWFEDFNEEPHPRLDSKQFINRRKVYENLLNTLSDKFGYTWEYSYDITENNVAVVSTKTGDKPVVLVKPDRIDISTVIHEFGHILFTHIKSVNRELYDNVLDKLNDDPLFEDSLDEVLRGYGPFVSKELLDNEILARGLEDYANGMIDKDTGLFKALHKFWEAIKYVLGGIFKNVKLDRLNPNTNIVELAHMVLDPDLSIDKGDIFTSKEFYELSTGKLYNNTKQQDVAKKIQLTQEEITDKLTNTFKNVVQKEIIEDGKTKKKYFLDKDGVLEMLEGVNTRLKKFGYGHLKEPDENIPSIRVGKIVHGNLENLANDIIEDLSDKYKVTLSKEAKKDLSTIFKGLKKDATALSEVVIADVETGLVGVVDLVIIRPNGRVELYDFKTKIRGLVGTGESERLRYSGFDYYSSIYKGGGQKYTQKDHDHLQLSIYAYIIQKALGIPVSSISVVRLNAIVRGKEVQEGKQTRFKPNTDKNEYINILEIDPYVENESMLEHPFYDEDGKVDLHNKTIRVVEGDDAYLHSKAMENKEKFRKERNEDVFADVSESKSKAGEIVSKLKDELAARLELARKRFSLERREDLETLNKALEEESSVTVSLYHIISNAYDNIEILNKEYNDYIKEGKVFTPELLYRWKEVVMSYKSLDDLHTLLQFNQDIIPDKKYITLLNEIVDKVKGYESLYKTEGRSLIAKWLTPYYNGIKVKFEDMYKAEWRKLRHRELKRNKLSLDEFENRYGDMETFLKRSMSGRRAQIEKDTYNLLYKELEVVSTDIGEMARWLDNMLDASDPVASAMIAAFMEAEEKARLSAIDKKYEITNAVEDLIKHRGKHTFTSEEDFYSFMLEHNKEGKPTQHLLKPWLSSFEEEADEIRKEYKLSRTTEETAEAVRQFKRQHNTFSDELFREAVGDFLTELFRKKEISGEEANAIAGYITNTISTIRIQDIAKLDIVSESTMTKLYYWFRKNRLFFYTWDSSEYLNPEWDKFMKLCDIDTKQSLYKQNKALKLSDNPYAVFYNAIEQIAKEANYMIPNGYQIYDRLPGIVKLNSERLKAGQDPFTIAKNTLKTELFVRPEDVERGNQEYTNEFGRVRYFIPVYYTAKIEPENQSYDLAGIYFKFWESANEYKHKREILPEMEMTRFFINTRKGLKRNVFKDILKTNGNTEDDPEPIYKDTTTLAEMLNDWFEMAIYGKFTKDEKALFRLSKNKSIDLMKVVDLLNRYTSLNLLGGNVVQGFANVLIGEVMQTIDVIAHEHVDAKVYTKASVLYSRYLPEILGDVGKRIPKSLPGLIYQEFNVLDEDVSETMFSENASITRAWKNTSIYFVQHCGEHWLQNRFLLAMLMQKKAYDKDGNLLGNMLDQYEKKDGKLVLNEKVNLVKSEWTERDIFKFKQKVKGILSRMHGEYSELGRVAIQRNALGRMAYMFRKFVVPGLRRRWGSYKYIERMGQYTEGNYITTMRFFKNYWQDLLGFKFALMSENWAGLSDHEKANIKRTLSEASFVIASIIVASMFSKSGDDDDEWLISFLAYQSYRLRAELLFFVSPSEAWSILRSPMASMAVLENILSLSHQLMQPGEVYERGPFKGQLKLKKIMLDFIPVYKQIYKARDIEQQINWFKN